MRPETSRKITVCLGWTWRGGDEAVGPNRDLDDRDLSVGVGSGLDEREPLPRDRILDRVSCAEHLLNSFATR